MEDKQKGNSESRIVNSEEEKLEEKKIEDQELQEEILQKPEEKEKTDNELAEEYLNDLKRCQAEFENYKKRQAAAEKELGGYLIEKIALDIIPVMDNFHSAMSHIPDGEKESAWVIGINHIKKQLEAVLTGSGMEIIEAKEGEEFDPKIHEAIGKEELGITNNELGITETTEKQENNQHKIAKVIQNGYKFGGRVIRPAKVTVK